MADREYLLNYGKMGDLGRFRAPAPLVCRRGEEVLVRSPRGLELGVVLCEAGPGHLRLLGAVGSGELLRPATAEDLHAAAATRQRGERLFADARQAAAELGLSLEILDVEV